MQISRCAATVNPELVEGKPGTLPCFESRAGENMPGGCETFDVQLDIDSFTSLETQLTSRNPTWTKERARREALVIFNTEMFPKQVGSYFAEKRGDTEIPVDQEYDVVDGKLAHPHYSFEGMIEHASTEEERASLKLLQETLVKAAAGTQVVAYDLSALNQSGIRYADLWSKGVDGKVKIEKRVDVTRGGNPLGLTEAWLHLDNFAREEVGRQIKTNGVPQVGIVVVAPDIKNTPGLVHELALSKTNQGSQARTQGFSSLSSAEEVKDIVRPQQELPLERPQTTDAIAKTVEEISQVTTTVARDTKDGVIAAYGFLAAPLATRLKEQFLKNKPDYKSSGEHESHTKRVIVFQRDSGAERKKREVPKHANLLAEKWQQAVSVKIAMVLAAETGVGVGAAIWGVERLSREKEIHRPSFKNPARRARSDQENRRRPRKEKSRAVKRRMLPENVQATASPKSPKEKLVERAAYKKKRVSSEPKRTKKIPESHRKHLRIQKEPRRTAHNRRREIKPVRVEAKKRKLIQGEAKKRTYSLKERKALRQSRRKPGQHKDTAPRNFAKTITEKINRERNHERQNYHATKVEYTDRLQRLIDARTRKVFIIFKKLMAAPGSRVFAEEAAVSSQTLEPHQTKELPVRNEQRVQQRKRAERSIVRRVTAAFILWFLLQPKEKAPKWKNRESVKIQKEEARQAFRFPQERSPWLLFAIIWYLAMLREQAVRTRGKQAVKKPAATNVQSFIPLRRTQMPTRGVIFSLHS